jgi:AcrR family transcriptional regulator
VTDARDRIVAAAAALLDRGGRDAVTTRAVSAEADVTEPTIYRLFGDKGGLLDAVTEYGFVTYLAGKPPVAPDSDPVDDLRAGWDQHVAFGLEHPALYALIYADPRPADTIPAAAAAIDVLRERIRRIAESGRLRVPEELAVRLVQAVGSGVTLALIATPPAQRGPALSVAAREAMLAAIVTDAPAVEAGPQAAAITLRANLSHTDALTLPESTLMTEWLDRIAADQLRRNN